MAAQDILLKPEQCLMLLVDFQAGLGFGVEPISYKAQKYERWEDDTSRSACLSRYSPHCKTDLRSLLSPLRACLTPASQVLALRRLEQAGARLTSWIQVHLEFQRDWAWARHETYEAARAIVVANGGGYGMGLAYG